MVVEVSVIRWDRGWNHPAQLDLDAKAETPVLWPPHAKSWLIGKDPDAGSDWGQEEKGTTEDEMAGWHHWLDGCEFKWTPGVGDGQGGPACCNSWGRKESDTTERLNWTELKYTYETVTLLNAADRVVNSQKHSLKKKKKEKEKHSLMEHTSLITCSFRNHHPLPLYCHNSVLQI